MSHANLIQKKLTKYDQCLLLLSEVVKVTLKLGHLHTYIERGSSCKLLPKMICKDVQLLTSLQMITGYSLQLWLCFQCGCVDGQA